jgi:hypothetical protein
MKTRILSFLLSLSFISGSLLFQSCEDVKDLSKFEVTKTMPVVSIPIVQQGKSTLIEQYSEFSQYLNVDSIKAAYGLTALELENGKVTGAVLTITAPAGANLAFLTSARLTLFSSTITEVQVAHTGTIDPIANSIQLIIDNPDITQILSGKHFQGRFYYDVDNNAMPAPSVMLELASTLKFTVAPL